MRLNLTIRADQLIECFRRNTLILFLINTVREKFGHKIDMEHTNTMVFENRFGTVKKLYVNSSQLFRPELQGLFSKAEMVRKLIREDWIFDQMHWEEES